jgi:hypothetical protein
MELPDQLNTSHLFVATQGLGHCPWWSKWIERQNKTKRALLSKKPTLLQNGNNFPTPYPEEVFYMIFSKEGTWVPDGLSSISKMAPLECRLCASYLVHISQWEFQSGGFKENINIIPALERLRQEDCKWGQYGLHSKIQVGLGNLVKPCQKKKKEKDKKKTWVIKASVLIKVTCIWASLWSVFLASSLPRVIFSHNLGLKLGKWLGRRVGKFWVFLANLSVQAAWVANP